MTERRAGTSNVRVGDEETGRESETMARIQILKYKEKQDVVNVTGEVVPHSIEAYPVELVRPVHRILALV
jgi:hypothetical protein